MDPSVDAMTNALLETEQVLSMLTNMPLQVVNHKVIADLECFKPENTLLAGQKISFFAKFQHDTFINVSNGLCRRRKYFRTFKCT